MSDMLFILMDVPNETRKLVYSGTFTEGMTESELKAYHMGISNTLSALEAVLEADDNVIAHMANVDMPTEMDIEEIEEILNKE